LFSVLGMLIVACGGGNNTQGSTTSGPATGATTAAGGDTTGATTAAGGDTTSATTAAGGDTTSATTASGATEAAGSGTTETATSGTMSETATSGGMTTETAMAGMTTETATSGATGETATSGAGNETATSGMTTETAMAGMTTETATSGAGNETATTAAMNETATSGTASGGAAAAALPAECTNVALQYWTPFTGPDGPFMQALVDKFNSSNQNIKVTMTIQSEYNTQLGTAAASGTLPDVAIINEDQVATQAFRNVLRPIDQVVQMAGIDKSDFPAVAWQAGQVAGKTYAVPLSFVAMTMYYNEDLLKKAGLSGPPTNKADFEKAAAAMTADGNNGFMITTGFPVQQIFQQLLHQYGGSEFSADGSKATWNSDAGVKALQWMKDVQGKYSQPNLEVDADLNAFKAGTVGMIWNGIWQLPNVTGKAVEFSGKAGPAPQIGDQPATWAGGPLLTLPVQKKGADKCKDAAAAVFFRYLIDNSAEWAKAGNIPASNKARNTAEFKALPQAAIAPSVANPVFPPPIPGVGDAFAPLMEGVSAIMSGNSTDIKAALDDSAKRADQILADNKKNFGDAPKGQ